MKLKAIILGLVSVLTLAQAQAVTDEQRRDIDQLPITKLVQSVLSMSWDLRSHDRYHCYYDAEVGPKPCDRMDTTSGQYEDFYQSVMTGCQGTELCPGANLSESSWTYIGSPKRICKHLVTKSCEKEILTVDQMKKELIDLLDLRESLENPHGAK